MIFFAALRARNASTFRRTNLLPQSYHVRICRAAIDTNKTRTKHESDRWKMRTNYSFGLASSLIIPLSHSGSYTVFKNTTTDSHRWLSSWIKESVPICVICGEWWYTLICGDRGCLVSEDIFRLPDFVNAYPKIHPWTMERYVDAVS